MVKAYNINYALACLKDNKKVYPKKLFYDIAKKYNKYKNLPLIAVTSRTGKADRMRGVESGMVEYITKPYSPDYLQNVVKRNIKFSFSEESVS